LKLKPLPKRARSEPRAVASQTREDEAVPSYASFV
jgi:hypothetical protein